MPRTPTSATNTLPASGNFSLPNAAVVINSLSRFSPPKVGQEVQGAGTYTFISFSPVISS